MTTNLNSILSAFSLRRAIAGIVLPPLLAYTFQPFPDAYLTFPKRIVFWVGVIGLALCVTWIARQLTQKYFADAHFSARDIALVLIILTIFVPSLWLMSWLLFAVGGQQAPGVLSVAHYGALFATGLVLVRGHGSFEQVEVEAPAVPPRLAKRLPDTFNGQIYRLTVKDHFVEVVTSQGMFTIRLRFTDAIAEMEPVPGHCTHRSHWVADDAIEEVKREAGKIFLRLKNDDLVPVSRKYKPVLEQDGVI